MPDPTQPAPMSEETDKPAYVRDAEWQIARALANLWVWGALVEQKQLPILGSYAVYPHQMALQGPQQMNGKRVVVTLHIESEANRGT